MRLCLAALLCTAATVLRAENWAPSSNLLDAVRHVESADGLLTVGDKGQSLGEYQISEAAWLDVNAWRKTHGLPRYDYVRAVWNPKISRSYAADYLRILRTQLQKSLGRAPSSAELYAAYNMGLASFIRRQHALVTPRHRLFQVMMQGR